jgi:GT2 family glycosyltransferase
MLTLVCATRTSVQDFHTQTLLGRCLPRLGEFMPFGLQLFANNTQPLGECYNAAIDAAAEGDALVFVHDDVRIDDWMLGQRLQDALNVFDVVGVAGNRRCQAGQVTWYLQPPAPNKEGQMHAPWDSEHLSGAIWHGPTAPGAPGNMSNYGPSPAPVALLDGVLIAARADRLRASGVRFDAALGFHFYDLDFCRSATAAGLKLGTWPIAITHASGGSSVQSQAWIDAQKVYWRKWGA